MSWIGWLAPLTAAVALTFAAVRPPDATPAHAGPWRTAFARLRRNRSATAAAAILAALCIVALLAPLLAPHDPVAQPDIVALKNLPPSLRHPFGTDSFSRDVFSRVVYGARVSLSIGVLSMLIAITVGTAVGAVAGYVGGRTDTMLMRLVDALLSIPRILLLIAVLVVWPRITIPALVLLIGLTSWFAVSRIVRAQVLAVRHQEFVTSAAALGAGRLRVLLRHVLPNVLSPVIVAATLGVGNVIILEAGLSYLGIGVQPPLPSWGNIIQDGSSHLAALWWISLFPGLAIVTTVMAFNTVGDGLRDALDPRQLPDR